MRHRTTPALPYAKDHTPYGPRDVSHGGLPERGRWERTNTSLPNFNKYASEKLFFKARGPFFTVGNLFPVADPIRSTDCGPERPRLHMATGEWRMWAGVTGGRYLGFHTYLNEFQNTSYAQGTAKGGMRGTRLNRLTMQKYRGQSYSQFTRTMGVGNGR